MANIAQTVNVLQAMILTEDDAVIRTPTYHVFAMNQGHQDARALPVVLRAPGPTAGATGEVDAFSASASVKQGRALVSLTNLDARRGLVAELDLRGQRVGEPSGRILTADTLSAHNTGTEPDAVAVRPFTGCQVIDSTLRVDLPPHAFVTVELPLQT
jgi:alpha-N-arabinofuranosidase